MREGAERRPTIHPGGFNSSILGRLSPSSRCLRRKNRLSASNGNVTKLVIKLGFFNGPGTRTTALVNQSQDVKPPSFVVETRRQEGPSISVHLRAKSLPARMISGLG